MHCAHVIFQKILQLAIWKNGIRGEGKFVHFFLLTLFRYFKYS